MLCGRHRTVRVPPLWQLYHSFLLLIILPFSVGFQGDGVGGGQLEQPHAFTEFEYIESVTNGGEFAFFEIVEPGDLSYTYKLSPSQFSPPFNGSSPRSLVLSTPPCGCGPITSRDLAGHIVLIERGDCSFVSKAVRAQEAGASGAIITDSDEFNDELMISMTDDRTERRVDIPVAFLLGKNGHYIRTVLERKGLDRATIHIPVNITHRSATEVNQPPWLVW